MITFDGYPILFRQNKCDIAYTGPPVDYFCTGILNSIAVRIDSGEFVFAPVAYTNLVLIPSNSKGRKLIKTLFEMKRCFKRQGDGYVEVPPPEDYRVYLVGIHVTSICTVREPREVSCDDKSEIVRKVMGDAKYVILLKIPAGKVDEYEKKAPSAAIVTYGYYV